MSEAEDSDSSYTSIETHYSTGSGRTVAYTLYHGRVSTIDNEEEDNQVLTSEEAVGKLQNILQKIQTDKGNTLTAKTKQHLQDITQALNKILIMKKKDEKKIEKTQNRIQEQEETIRKTQKQMDKTDANKIKLQSIVEKSLKKHTERLEEFIKTFEDTTKKIQIAAKEAAAAAPTANLGSATQEEEEEDTGDGTTENRVTSKTQKKPQKNHEEHQQRRKEEERSTEPAHRRTIIIKSAGARHLTGFEINTLIDQQHIVASSKTIENQARRKNHVEIRCHTTTLAKQLQRMFQQNQKLNKLLSFTMKTAPTQKMILMGVQAGYEESQLKEIIKETHDLTEAELIIVGKRQGRFENTENWIIILPVHTAKEIISEGGLQIAFRRCRLSPFTSITRCRKCQAIGHTTQRCKNPTQTCEKCGGNHAPETCDREEKCPNCTHSNKNQRTRYRTDHKASDAHCYTYRAAYQKERERLNYLFYEEAPQEQTYYPEPPQQYPPYWNYDRPYWY